MDKYFVYVLEDDFKKKYKGMTNDIKRRISEHKRGKTVTTSKMKNIKLIYSEQYLDFEEARARELYLKSAAGRKFLRNRLGD